MFLFFDTETTGLPRNWKAPVTQLSNWPRMVQLAWLCYDRRQNLISEANHIIKPDGYMIPGDAADVHGITTETALEKGSDLASVLRLFSEAINQSRLIIAHNMDFDEKIVGAEFLRVNQKSKLFSVPRFCTMRSSTDLCKIPGNYGFKWPRLQELHSFLFGSEFEDAHNALADVRICAKCFFELFKRGHFHL